MYIYIYIYINIYALSSRVRCVTLHSHTLYALPSLRALLVLLALLAVLGANIRAFLGMSCPLYCCILTFMFALLAVLTFFAVFTTRSKDTTMSLHIASCYTCFTCFFFHQAQRYGNVVSPKKNSISCRISSSASGILFLL